MKPLRLTEIATVFGLAAVFTAASITASLREGVLAVPPTYDDIDYFNDAAQRLLILYNQNLPALLRSFMHMPPHSPLATSMAFLGFMLFGMHPWAVYLVNGVWVFLLLLGLRLALAAQPLWLYAAAALAFLSWPMTGYFVLEGRPDVVCGFVTAMGCLLILFRPWNGSPRGHFLCAGGLAGFALWCKPTIFEITLTLFGAAYFLTSAVDYLERRAEAASLSRHWRNLLIFSVPLLTLSLPYYIFGWRQIVYYIYINYVGTQKNIWIAETTLSPYQEKIYYLWGLGGQRTMGGWLEITLAFIVLAGAVRPRWAAQNLRRIIAVMLWFIVTFLCVTLPDVRSPYLGIVLPSAVLLLFFVTLRFLLEGLEQSNRLQTPCRIGAAAILLLLAFIEFHWHVYYYTGGVPRIPGSQAVYQQRFALIDQITGEIAASLPAGGTVYVPTAMMYLNSSGLQFALYQRGITNIKIGSGALQGALRDHEQAIDSADLIVLPAPADPELIPYLPSSAIARQISARVAQDPAFTLLASFAAADGAGPVMLYARKPVFMGVAPAAGFLPEEGPYPQWQLARIDWAAGAEAHLTAANPAGHVLTLRGRSPYANQSISVSAGGQAAGTCTLPSADRTGTCIIHLPPAAKNADITLQFSHPGSIGQGLRTVLFQDIWLQ